MTKLGLGSNCYCFYAHVHDDIYFPHLFFHRVMKVSVIFTFSALFLPTLILICWDQYTGVTMKFIVETVWVHRYTTHFCQALLHRGRKKTFLTVFYFLSVCASSICFFFIIWIIPFVLSLKVNLATHFLVLFFSVKSLKSFSFPLPDLQFETCCSVIINFGIPDVCPWYHLRRHIPFYSLCSYKLQTWWASCFLLLPCSLATFSAYTLKTHGFLNGLFIHGRPLATEWL